MDGTEPNESSQYDRGSHPSKQKRRRAPNAQQFFCGVAHAVRQFPDSKRPARCDRDNHLQLRE